MISTKQSRRDIETLLEESGATRIVAITEVDRASVGFTIGDWSVLFKLRLPGRYERRFVYKKDGYQRGENAAGMLWEQACRSAWRALLLTIKSKLISISSGIETFEEAFLSHVVRPGSNGETMGEQLLPQLRDDIFKAKQLTAGTK
jgi:hypothetical protein